MIASEIIFITLNNNFSSSVYILNDEEDLVHMHYTPNVMARNRVDIDANLWMTAIDLYLERSVDNAKDECIIDNGYDRGKCIEAKIYEQRFMNLCDLPWDIIKEENNFGNCTYEDYLEKGYGIAAFARSLRFKYSSDFDLCPGNFQVS